MPDLQLSNSDVLEAALHTLLPDPRISSYAKTFYDLESIANETDAKEKAAELIGDIGAYSQHSFRR